MKKLTVLGSTGSIGTQTLDIVRHFPDKFKVSALSCGHNTELLKKQIKEFRPELVCVADENDARSVSKQYPNIEVVFGDDGLMECASGSDADMVVGALLGMLGIRPTLAAIESGKDIAFANKETLVAGGSLIMDAVKRKGINFLPVDSEHSAIFQCLQGAAGNKPRKIILTASGGPFRGYSAEKLASVTKKQALKHPNWSMGAKITIDSATMMNKGLEVIEASWLFGIDPSDIEVVVHPQSAIHSAVEFEDGAIIAQIGAPDMHVPIAYALSYPDRLPDAGKKFSFFGLAGMSFEKPDPEVFRCLKLAHKAIEEGRSYPIVLNASNEEAVSAFLADRISFIQIADCVEFALNSHIVTEITSVDDILEVERRCRKTVREYIRNLG